MNKEKRYRWYVFLLAIALLSNSYHGWRLRERVIENIQQINELKVLVNGLVESDSAIVENYHEYIKEIAEPALERLEDNTKALSILSLWYLKVHNLLHEREEGEDVKEE
jgi:hypothetical protein